jgi:hypothetical protein
MIDSQRWVPKLDMGIFQEDFTKKTGDTHDLKGIYYTISGEINDKLIIIKKKYL